MILISPPEIASGLPAWKAFLVRLDAKPLPEDQGWRKARADAVDNIAWFESLPPDAPAWLRLGPTAVAPFKGGV
jgi:hypothetical protein